MSDKYTQKIAKEMLKKFNSQGVPSKTVNSAFGKFDESTVFIPWYLKPFAKKIRAIACHHFFSGYFSGYYSNTTEAGNTVKIKRPKAYASAVLEPSEQEIHDAIDKLVPNNASLNDLVKSIASREGK
tara:strand:- start:4664 stop:5044 length:381 start_codon:yes stop_codon:yes gene_type:complete